MPVSCSCLTSISHLGHLREGCRERFITKLKLQHEKELVVSRARVTRAGPLRSPRPIPWAARQRRNLRARHGTRFQGRFFLCIEFLSSHIRYFSSTEFNNKQKNTTMAAVFYRSYLAAFGSPNFGGVKLPARAAWSASTASVS